MQKPPIPLDEAERLAALRSYRVLDTQPESDFDALTETVAMVFGTPIALVSLVDTDRQWFKARVGLDARETSRDIAFCAHAMLGNDVFVVPNALEDPRFADNPLVVHAPQIRFYAGAPLIDPEGRRLGTLCAIDREPRQPTEQQLGILQRLAGQVIKLLELRRVAAQLAESLGRARTLQRLIPICAHCKKVREDQDYWTRVEDYIHAQTGADFTHGICPHCFEEHYGHLPDAQV